MGLSKLDSFYRRLILTKFYTRGWGEPEELREILRIHGNISDRKTCVEYIKEFGRQEIVLSPPVHGNECTTINGRLETPVCHIMPNLIPEECKTAYFQMVLPPNHDVKKQKNVTTSLKERIKDLALHPLCVHMAGTGDHGFSRRRELLAKPLLSHGISSLLLENPYYGKRKPKEQTRSGLLQVKDLFIMGLCLVLEAQILLHWLEKEGYGPLGLTGISMGGHMASLAATNWPKPIAITPCMSWTSASVVWTEGVLSKAIPWRVLESQYATNPQYETEINELLQRDTVDSYELGKDYVKDEGAIKLPSTKRLAEEKRSARKKDKNDKERRRRQTLLFMKGVMDQVTDIRNFSVPVDPTLATFVIAKADAYYPIRKLQPMNEIWPGCQVRFLDTGHIAGFLMHHKDFCIAIADTFERLIKKYHTSGYQEMGVGPSEDLPEVQNTPENSLVRAKNTRGISLLQTLKVFTIKS